MGKQEWKLSIKVYALTLQHRRASGRRAGIVSAQRTPEKWETYTPAGRRGGQPARTIKAAMDPQLILNPGL